MNGRKSFSAYVAATRYHAVERIMTKARAANQLAKTVAGPGQRRLYELKHRFISRALELAPESLVVDSLDLRQGVIGIQSVINGIRLHAPAAQLTPRAKAAVLEQIARVIHRVQ
jgi:hypothetical protein